MKAIIIANGSYLNKEKFIDLYEDDDYIICADGGLNYAYDINIKPNLLLGDLDSVNQDYLNFYKDIDINRYKPEKDYTDTELAIITAIKLGYTEVCLICATGTRLDHTSANINLIEKYCKYNINISVIDNNNIIYGITGKRLIYKKDVESKYISLIPITDNIYIKYLKGFKYSLNSTSVPRGSTLCISNEIVQEEAEINLVEGFALLIYSND